MAAWIAAIERAAGWNWKRSTAARSARALFAAVALGPSLILAPALRGEPPATLGRPIVSGSSTTTQPDTASRAFNPPEVYVPLQPAGNPLYSPGVSPMPAFLNLPRTALDGPIICVGREAAPSAWFDLAGPSAAWLARPRHAGCHDERLAACRLPHSNVSVPRLFPIAPWLDDIRTPHGCNSACRRIRGNSVWHHTEFSRFRRQRACFDEEEQIPCKIDCLTAISQWPDRPAEPASLFPDWHDSAARPELESFVADADATFECRPGNPLNMRGSFTHRNRETWHGDSGFGAVLQTPSETPLARATDAMSGLHMQRRFNNLYFNGDLSFPIFANPFTNVNFPVGAPPLPMHPQFNHLPLLLRLQFVF